MDARRSKALLFKCLLALAFSANGYGQDVANANETGKKWFIVLPLRFTQLQSNNTMLSGVRIGRKLNRRFNASVSVYHSFYLNAFRAKANLAGFDEQPRLYINCTGIELEYNLFQNNRFTSGVQLLVGWGFVTYQLNEQDFDAKQVNYIAIEPALNAEYKTGSSTFIGLGIGYRPLLTDRTILYSSRIANGEIPILKSFPNGVNVILTVKGFL
ncbi:MAG: hypothetical protein MUD08_13865 [Cytophagales bacterium]|nr:hypothetical protein [Cytophagales bacterium]